MKPTTVSFDALEIGAQGRSGGRTLTEADLSFSCMISGGWHPIHADSEFARNTVLGQRILHGSYCLMIATGLAADLPNLGHAVITDLGVRDWRYLQPVFAGDTLYAEVEIIGKRVTSNPARGVLERRIKLIKASGTIAHEGISALLIEREITTP